MLTTYLTNTLSPTKFILIEDTFEDKGKRILNYLIQQHVNSRKAEVNYFVFEGSYVKTKTSFFSQSDIVFHNFVTSEEINDFEQTITNLSNQNVIVIESLSDMIIQYGLSETYKVLHSIVADKRVVQLIAVLHLDVLEEPVKSSRSFEHLSTCHLKLEPDSRIIFIFKKLGGKIIRLIEEYRFENDTLITEPIKKLDPQTLVQQSISNVIPDDLTTFKISLDEHEKESRDKLVLPYLPRNDDGSNSNESKIFYKFDAIDDWDEEDPDDDLDI